MAAEFDAVAHNFDSPEEVKNVLLKIFHARAADLITDRRAGILTYITHTILQAQSAKAYCQKLAAEKAAAADAQLDENPLPLTWNLTRSPEELAGLAERNPRAALAVIRQQCLSRLQKENQAPDTLGSPPE